MWEGVPRGVEELCIRTNEDDMVRRGDPWGSDSGSTRAVDPFPTLQSVLEWAAVLFAVSSDHEDDERGFHSRHCRSSSGICTKILRAARVHRFDVDAN